MNSYKLDLEAKAREAGIALVADGPDVTAVDNMKPYAYAGQTSADPWEASIFDGGKFFGGFGTTQIQHVDYWTLRQRSAQLFTENLYARGLVRRLVTNEINTGLTPEAFPDEKIIGVEEESLAEWTEDVENRFHLWGRSPRQCDWKHASTFGELQRKARTEALVSGDVLVVLRQSQRTRLPMVQLVSGDKVQTPLFSDSQQLTTGHKIQHGVELDTVGRVVAHWIRQEDGTSKRLPAFGARSGRRLSWLVYGTDKRLDDVRGQPLLSLVLQSLKEIDRYRDSTQRKAVVNSIVAMAIKKTQDKPSTLPITGGAVRRDQAAVADADGTPRTFNIATQIPGLALEELQTGEEPVFYGGQGTDSDFGAFEEAIIQAVAWANEIPPEILRLSFSNNYSASQAAINEFKIYLNKVWSEWGENFCAPIEVDWLISEVLTGKISAPGLLEAWRDPRKQDIFAAWINAEWYGSIKPSTDTLKQAKGSKLLTENGWSTNARESRLNTGTKFSKNVQRLKRENEQLVKAMEPIIAMKERMAGTNAGITAELQGAVDSIVDNVAEAVADAGMRN